MQNFTYNHVNLQLLGVGQVAQYRRNWPAQEVTTKISASLSLNKKNLVSPYRTKYMNSVLIYNQVLEQTQYLK